MITVNIEIKQCAKLLVLSYAMLSSWVHFLFFTMLNVYKWKRGFDGVWVPYCWRWSIADRSFLPRIHPAWCWSHGQKYFCDPDVMGFRLLRAHLHPLKWNEMKVNVAQSCPSLWPHGLYSPCNSPSQNTGVGSLSLLLGIFPTQGLSPGLPHCRQIFFCTLCPQFTPQSSLSAWSLLGLASHTWEPVFSPGFLLPSNCRCPRHW